MSETKLPSDEARAYAQDAFLADTSDRTVAEMTIARAFDAGRRATEQSKCSTHECGHLTESEREAVRGLDRSQADEIRQAETIRSAEASDPLERVEEYAHDRRGEKTLSDEDLVAVCNLARRGIKQAQDEPKDVLLRHLCRVLLATLREPTATEFERESAMKRIEEIVNG